ncbi:hypothetical protein, partial [Thiolapillus sp.]|uniref:hypothetical protein n=1 Tax=Thiolapillus sp. TaxID=2017437 RepID=UPI0025E045A4
GFPLFVSWFVSRDLFTQISALALFLSSPLSLLRSPYVGSPLSVSPSVFRDVFQIAISIEPATNKRISPPCTE